MPLTDPEQCGLHGVAIQALFLAWLPGQLEAAAAWFRLGEPHHRYRGRQNAPRLVARAGSLVALSVEPSPLCVELLSSISGDEEAKENTSSGVGRETPCRV